MDTVNNKLDCHEIELRLPHAGSMNLLHEIINFDQTSLNALAISHLESNNPLRVDGKIATINGVEYAAQAMAVHGSLLSERDGINSPVNGYIASVRNIDIQIPSFPEQASPLKIKVEQLMSNDNGFTYQFYLSCEQQLFISGKITVFLIRIKI
jgi:predicted hotdog family 3-hydroxylacyl-ACP dehydratase